MKVLVLGSGGREHALVHWLSKDEQIKKIWIAPGNGGTSDVAESIDLHLQHFDEILNFCQKEKIDFMIPGPEQPLVDGIADYFQNQKSKTFVLGPHKSGAQLEASKSFSKAFMREFNIPCAESKTFTSERLGEAFLFLEKLSAPFVLKADGLAAGKGVLILNNLAEAKSALTAMLIDKQFGSASEKVVVEEFLEGIEFSVFILTDGTDYVLLPEAKDYKRIGEGDIGLNTGGMGSISPVPFFDESLRKKVEKKIIEPTLHGIKSRGLQYCGFLFFGLMVVGSEPYVIEYNARMGDPETQSVLPRMISSAGDLLHAVKTNSLKEHKIEIDSRACSSVVMVSGGYPGNYAKNKEIEIGKTEDYIFHAGTKKVGNKLYTNGGRVLASTAMGKDARAALKKSYQQIKQVSFENCYYRKDIGKDILK